MDPIEFNKIKKDLLLPRHPHHLSEHSKCQERICEDCDEKVLGRHVYYILKNIGQKNPYWSKKCVTCNTTVGKNHTIDRDFLGLKKDLNK